MQFLGETKMRYFLVRYGVYKDDKRVVDGYLTGRIENYNPETVVDELITVIVHKTSVNSKDVLIDLIIISPPKE